MPENEPQGCLFAILKLFGIAPRGPVAPSLPYRRKDYLLSKAERSFFGVLQQVVADQYLIFAMVRIADLVYIPRGTEKRQSHFNRIQSKHIDFVLCDKDAVRPLLAIELDDSSHKRKDRQDRDSFVDSALQAAGLPLLRVPARKAYNPDNLRQSIRDAIGT
jgi:hypothetical protein